MSAHRGPDDDVRDLVRHGSASWTGPSPRASQSRWGAGSARRPVLHGGLRLTAAGLAAVLLGAFVVTSSESPRRAAATVAQLVSGVPPAPASTPAAPVPPASLSPSPARSAAVAPHGSRPEPRRPASPARQITPPWPGPPRSPDE